MRIIKSDNYNQQSSGNAKPKSYFNVGHDWHDNNISKGCAYMWYLTVNGEFICEQESDDIRHHEHVAPTRSIYRMAYKGRVDVCSKHSSIVTCDGCIDDRSRIPKEQCDGLRKMAIDCIHQRFGKNIVIHSF